MSAHLAVWSKSTRGWLDSGVSELPLQEHQVSRAQASRVVAHVDGPFRHGPPGHAGDPDARERVPVPQSLFRRGRGSRRCWGPACAPCVLRASSQGPQRLGTSPPQTPRRQTAFRHLRVCDWRRAATGLHRVARVLLRVVRKFHCRQVRRRPSDPRLCTLSRRAGLGLQSFDLWL
eukprot:Amastigsp_a858676_10.p3 type:complete len:175 gc:universal Amastigsp_a858676_10:805-281(-)